MPITPITIVSVTQTCYACPSQWEGKLEDGRFFYVRYRWGTLTLEVSESESDNVMDALNGPTLLEKEIGDGLDGCLMWEEVLDIFKDEGIIE